MCLILVAWRMHPQYPCVVAANRDEFHERPSAPAQWWADKPHILAGRDLSAGGTWLGITRTGRLAALTNYRGAGPQRADAPSRGGLVTEVLESNRSVAESLAHLRTVAGAYNGFNLILCDGERLGVYESVTGEGRILAPGIYGLSNDVLDTPWPKVNTAKSRLIAALAELDDENSLLGLLRDERTAPDAQLPDTGVGVAWERLLSSAFILSPQYGTRSSTVVRIDRSRQVRFDEWTWSPAGDEIGKTSVSFDLEAAGNR
jgi:uncharacterized protein with NRDE domain